MVNPPSWPMGLGQWGVTVNVAFNSSVLSCPVQQATSQAEPSHLPGETKCWGQEVFWPDITWVLFLLSWLLWILPPARSHFWVRSHVFPRQGSLRGGVYCTHHSGRSLGLSTQNSPAVGRHKQSAVEESLDLYSKPGQFLTTSFISWEGFPWAHSHFSSPICWINLWCYAQT